MFRRIFLLLLVLCPLFAAAADEPASPLSQSMFEKYSPGILQVRVLERRSSTKSSIGSGFLVSDDGRVVTNYHVISKVVFDIDKYRLDVVDREGNSYAASVRGLDVVHDVAVIQVLGFKGTVLPSQCKELAQGEHLFSFGNPHDLGTTVVEGIYNGNVEYSLFDRLHFTGSINPGMSGGPVFTSDGRLAGVNVATSGEQISFLVPCKYASALIVPPGGQSPGDLVQMTTAQLTEYQDSALTPLFQAPLRTSSLGEYSVPSHFFPSLKCWSKSEDITQGKYSYLNHQCTGEHEIFVDEDVSAGSIYAYYTLVNSSQLNEFQFADLVEGMLQRFTSGGDGSSDFVTNYRCTSDFVRRDKLMLRVQTCIRAHKRLSGLYDTVVVFDSFDSSQSSLLGYFAAMGVSFKNAEQLGRAIIGGVSRRGV